MNCFPELISLKFLSCRLPQANLLQHFICYSISKRQAQKPKLILISFHIYGMMITFWGLMKKTGNDYDVIQVSRESMLLRILLTYWGRKVSILKVVMFLRKNLIYQDTKNFSITNRLERVFFFIIQKISKHPSQVYRICHLLSSNPPSIVVPKLSLHQMKLTHLKFQASLLHQI